jgi:Epoxide hydrolase N terminus
MTEVAQDTMGAAAIRQFKVCTPQAELDDLRRRIATTRWPDRETVTDDSQGVPPAALQGLVSYWGAEYDWRKLIHYNRVDKGGHYGALEQPQLFCEEVRAGLRSLR